MLRRMIGRGLLAVALVGAAGSAHAGVRVNIGIDIPAPPLLVAVPASPVMYAPAVPANYFFYGGQFFVFTSGVWHVGPAQNGPWAVLAPELVPRPILAVPVRYYHAPPREWNHRRREGPPPWAPAWGRRWHEERDGHREWSRGERRDGRR